jgi:hypothetical protein
MDIIQLFASQYNFILQKKHLQYNFFLFLLKNKLYQDLYLLY